jgi:hypothetical protein
MIRTLLYLLGIALLVSAIALTTRPGAAATLPLDVEPGQPASHTEAHSSRLVEQVREATAIFRDVNQAIGYEPFGGCVSGPEQGAMGVHFVNREFLLDGDLNVNRPEALIYEFKNGYARLVGVEYIVLAAQWDAAHTEPPAPPVLEGQLFHFNESPNRFRLDPFYELHVWAWRDNPNGTFADWNTRVSCDGQ